MGRALAVVMLVGGACGPSQSLPGPPVACQAAALLGGNGCQCAIASAATSFDCSAAALPQTTCCADTSWPVAGTCACLPNVPTCIQSTASASCFCFVGNRQTANDAVVTSCTSQGGGKCCSAMDDIGTCHCNVACSSSEVEVAACVPSAVTICPSGSSHTDRCSPSP